MQAAGSTSPLRWEHDGRAAMCRCIGTFCKATAKAAHHLRSPIAAPQAREVRWSTDGGEEMRWEGQAEAPDQCQENNPMSPRTKHMLNGTGWSVLN